MLSNSNFVVDTAKTTVFFPCLPFGAFRRYDSKTSLGRDENNTLLGKFKSLVSCCARARNAQLMVNAFFGCVSVSMAKSPKDTKERKLRFLVRSTKLGGCEDEERVAAEDEESPGCRVPSRLRLVCFSPLLLPRQLRCSRFAAISFARPVASRRSPTSYATRRCHRRGMPLIGRK